MVNKTKKKKTKKIVNEGVAWCRTTVSWSKRNK